MHEQLKRLREKAAKALGDGRAIFTEFEGKEMPAEKKATMNKYFDEVDACRKDIEGLERQIENEKFLSDPLRKHPGGEPPATGDLDADSKAILTLKKMALNKYIRNGVSALNMGEIKALSVGDSTAGGYLVADTMLPELLTKMKPMTAMRQIARVLPPISGGSVIVISVDNDLGDPTWTTELGTGDEDSVKPFGKKKLSPSPFARRVKVSNTLLRQPTIDVEGFINDELSVRYSVVEDNGYFNGNSVDQPQGLLNASGLPVHTTKDSNLIADTDIVNWIFKLPARYASNARIACNRAFIRKLYTMKNTVTGELIWKLGMREGAADTILNVPYVNSDQIDDGLDANDAWEDSKIVAVIGDFRYYWIVDSLNYTLKRLDELYAETDQTGFIGRKESDGSPVLKEAFYGLKIKA